jgi:hypothetical protein
LRPQGWEVKSTIIKVDYSNVEGGCVDWWARNGMLETETHMKLDNHQNPQ